MQLTQGNKDLSKSPLFLLAPFFFLGTAMVVMKFILPNTSPLFLAGIRLVPAGLLILIGTAIAKLPQPKGWKAWGWIIIFGVVDGALFQGFLTEGLVHTGAGLGSVLIDTQPLVVALLSRLILGDLIGLWGWIGLFVGLTGVALCGLPEQFIYGLLKGGSQIEIASFDWNHVLQSGEFLMIVAALAMSFGTIIVRYVKQYADPIVGTGWHMIIGGVPLLVLSWLYESGQVNHLHPGDWAGLGYSSVFGTAVTYGIFFYLAANGNVTSVSALIFLTPVFALLFSYLTLGEQLTNLQWIGVVLTLVSVFLVNQRKEIAEWMSSLNAKPLSEVITAEVLTDAGESIE
ncbi:EamA family transporter [Phormidium sp. CLA17]|uniref:DMT family transporter n=1 Tax=Leptolyngbya sp. Cla-17 TaxID=2803751 RepID=UPI0014912E25|nr:DMT family transporter [Leptolyngbya sp. Cla-17]MBM0743125.1 EamA family transporter [Leptolyngbya sp. Cla-17]